MLCPNCGFDSPPEMRFCGQCGAHLKQTCPECNFANPLNYRFCGLCGAPLPSEPDRAPLSRPTSPVRTPPERELSIPSEPALLPLEGERRPVTVVLADVVGSTALLEQLGTETWVEIMNRILQILETEVYHFGGEVDQFRGDGLVAFFGATLAHEDDPERGVLSALAMQAAIKSYAAELFKEKGLNVTLRVGVNTGEVIVASIGDSRQHSEDTVMGEAVALAARMEGAAEPGTVLVSENSYHLTQSQFTWQPLGEIVVKGMSQPVAIYRPLTARTDVEQLSDLPAHGLAAPLIGREAEFETLSGRLDDLKAGQGGIVLLSGEGGMGKSRLITEARQQFSRQEARPAAAGAGSSPSQTPPPLTWLLGRCRSYNQERPYSVWRDLLRHWLSTAESEPEAEISNRLHCQAEALWGERLAEHYPYLAAFLSLPLAEPFAEQVKYLDAEGLQQQFHLSARGWVEAMAQRGPLVLVFGNTHWIDASSLELLEYCLPVCDREALLWLITFRPKRAAAVWDFAHRAATEYPHRVTRLTAAPLTEAQSNEMIDHLIGRGVLPAETRALVLDKAGGNPYYIEELIHSLIEQEALVQDILTGQWHATRAVAALDLPDTLQSLLLARIDSLAAEERRILHMASVLGVIFASDVLQALAGDATSLPEHLIALQRAQLIRERGRLPDLGMEYAFKSALIRDAAYDSILSTQRATYHRQAAEYLEQQVVRETEGQYFGMLAYHYQRAGEHGKELFYTLLAAEQAREVYANAEALELFTRALELLNEMEAQATKAARLYAIHTRKFEVLDGRRQVLYLMGDFKAGRADAQALLPLARQLDDDPAWLIDALLQQPGVANWINREELQAGLALAEEALGLARQLGDRRRQMQSLGVITRLRFDLNDPTWEEMGEQTLELARQLGDRRYEVNALIDMGQAYAGRDQPERSMAYLAAALPISRELDDKLTETNLLDLMGLQFERSGDYYRLLTEYQQKRLRISREIGLLMLEGNALLFCGQIQGTYLGDYAGGLALLAASLSIWQDTSSIVFPLLRMAQIQVAQARYDEALATFERVHHIDEQNIIDLGRAGLRLVSVILYNALGDEAHLRQSLELAAQTHQLVADNLISRQYEMASACKSAAAHLGLAECLADEAESQAHRRQALESSQKALAIYEQFGFAQIVECVSEEILFRHSQALAANGHAAEAAEYRQRAYDEMMRKHDLIPPDSAFRQTYLENIPLHRDIRQQRA